MDLKSALVRPLGPLPAWGWGVAIGGGYLGYRLLTGKGLPTTPSSGAASDTGSGGADDLSSLLSGGDGSTDQGGVVTGPPTTTPVTTTPATPSVADLIQTDLHILHLGKVYGYGSAQVRALLSPHQLHVLNSSGAKALDAEIRADLAALQAGASGGTAPQGATTSTPASVGTSSSLFSGLGVGTGTHPTVIGQSPIRTIPNLGRTADRAVTGVTAMIRPPDLGAPPTVVHLIPAETVAAAKPTGGYSDRLGGAIGSARARVTTTLGRTSTARTPVPPTPRPLRAAIARPATSAASVPGPQVQ